MIRRFNYTGRSRLPLKSIHLEITGHPPTLAVECEPGQRLPTTGIRAEVDVKDTGGLRRLRQSMVRAESSWRMDGMKLEGIDIGSARVRVLFIDDSGTGKIRACSTEIRIPDAGEGRQAAQPASILPVRYEDNLQGAAWRLELPPESDPPTILVTRELPDSKHLVRRDPLFRLLVLPSAVESILEHYFGGNDEPDVMDDDDTTTAGQWLRWAQLTLDDPKARPTGSREDRQDWIRETVSRFSKAQKLLDHAIHAWEGQG